MPHEIHEHIEHAGHGEHGGGPQSSLPRFIGITIAMLGVLMALCSAQLGAARTELVSTMVDENNAKGDYAARSNKYRGLQSELQHLHSAMPDLKLMAKKNNDLKALESKAGSEDTRIILTATRWQSEKVLNTVIPTPGDVRRFLVLIEQARKENEAAHEWSESYHEAVEIHKNTAEMFEYALVGAEIAVVIASVGLLLAKQARFALSAFCVAVLLGVISLSIAGQTFFHNRSVLHAAEAKIEHSHEKFKHLNRDKQDVEDDMKLEKSMEDDLPELEHVMKGS